MCVDWLPFDGLDTDGAGGECRYGNGRRDDGIDALYNYLESYLGSDTGRVEFAAETANAAVRKSLPDAAE